MKKPNIPAAIQSSAQPVTEILGRELVVQHLGFWPTFEDFEVLSITLERAFVSNGTHDLRAIFLGFDINKSLSAPDRKQFTVEILFESVENLRIDGFNHQNPILGLHITATDKANNLSLFNVKWGGTGIRHDVSFGCKRISVLRVVNLNPFSKSNPGIELSHLQEIQERREAVRFGKSKLVDGTKGVRHARAAIRKQS